MTITIPAGVDYYVYTDDPRAVRCEAPLTVAARAFHGGMWAFEQDGAVCLVLRSACKEAT